jgi:predicted NAD/FAD-binding protein
MTAVEWLQEALSLTFEQEMKFEGLFQQAKEMENQKQDKFAKQVLRTYISKKTLQYKQSQGDYSLDELLNIIKKEIRL